MAAKDLTFLLGFYVSMVAKRWWDQVALIPEIDQLATLLGGLVMVGPENTEQALNFKKTVLRHCLLSYLLLMRKISKGLRATFNSVDTVRDKGLVTEKVTISSNLNKRA